MTLKCAVPICNQEARPGRRTCSPGCSQLWRDVYRHQVERQRSYENQARWVLKNPDKCKPSRVAWAKKVLASAGESVIESP